MRGATACTSRLTIGQKLAYMCQQRERAVSQLNLLIGWVSFNLARFFSEGDDPAWQSRLHAAGVIVASDNRDKATID